jgi:protoporphyrinogen oxidase
VSHDAIVLGAGPAGLGAALALARSGARVALVEASQRVGGLCVTLRRGDLAYDLGGHIMFVHDEARRAWLDELLGDDLLWVDRPVVCVREGQIRPGRYLDQRPDEAPEPNGSGPSAWDFLSGCFGGAFVDRVMRRYLEKVDGMPLERMLAARAQKLMVEQYAPKGFFYPAGGIGQLMDRMAEEFRGRGGDVLTDHRVTAIPAPNGRVDGVEVDGPDGPVSLTSRRVIAGLPPALIAGLVTPGPPPGTIPTLAGRAAAIVYLEAPVERLTPEAWVQVDDPGVPFARMFEAKNWSDRLVPPERTVLGCECYCVADDEDPAWGLSDADLAAACAASLADPLGVIGDPSTVRPLEVVRLPRAWPLVDVDQLDRAAAPAQWLWHVDGLTIAQGGDVVLAIAAGEQAAATAG